MDDEPKTDARGVDLTLVRHTLDQTPTERLRALESYMNTMATVRVVRRAGHDEPHR